MSEESNGTHVFGNCEYCDQSMGTPGFASQEEADDYATRHCKCPEAQELYGEDDAETREEKLENCAAAIDRLFGGGAGERGKKPLKDGVVRLLKTAAELMVDNEARRVTVAVDRGVTAVLFRKAKGKIATERKEYDGEIAES